MPHFARTSLFRPDSALPVVYVPSSPRLKAQGLLVRREAAPEASSPSECKIASGSTSCSAPAVCIDRSSRDA
jgi:hypothetical protein